MATATAAPVADATAEEKGPDEKVVETEETKTVETTEVEKKETTPAPAERDTKGGVARPEPEATRPPTQEEWLAETKRGKLDEPNARKPDMTNRQVRAILAYQIARKGAKASEPLTPEQGRLLREAARVAPTHVLDSKKLNGHEKKALGAFETDELSAEELERSHDKKGLGGIARFRWITEGLNTTQQAVTVSGQAPPEPVARASTAKRGRDPESGQLNRSLADGRMSNKAWEKLCATSDGVVTFAITNPDKGTAVMLGHLPLEEKAFHKAVEDELERRGLKLEKVTLVTIWAKHGYVNRPESMEQRYRPPMVGFKS